MPTASSTPVSRRTSRSREGGRPGGVRAPNHILRRSLPSTRVLQLMRFSPVDAPDITIGIACFNEEESIVPSIETAVAALGRSGLSWEILVMDDASTDCSRERVASWIAGRPDLPVRHRVSDVNRGLEWNVFQAATTGNGRYFWMVAGDNVLTADNYSEMFSRVGTADIVIPWVLSYRGRSFHRRLISRLYVAIVNALSGFRIHYYNGSSIYRRTDIAAYAGIIHGFSYSAELIMELIRRGRSYVEVQTVFNERTRGKSRALRPRNFVAVGEFFLRLLRRRVGLGRPIQPPLEGGDRLLPDAERAK